jgi:regulator of replication initiation timing
MATMAKRDDELKHLHDENDALRMEIVQLRTELGRKDQTIDQLELKARAKEKQMGDLHGLISQLGVAYRDLETENRNLKLAKERLLESLAEKRAYREAMPEGRDHPSEIPLAKGSH